MPEGGTDAIRATVNVTIDPIAIPDMLALLALLRYTMLGKAIRAMMQSPAGAQLVGIDTGVLHPVVFGAVTTP